MRSARAGEAPLLRCRVARERRHASRRGEGRSKHSADGPPATLPGVVTMPTNPAGDRGDKVAVEPGTRSHRARLGAARVQRARAHHDTLPTPHERLATAMCGIVGYVGPRQASDVLLGGLARLEYRGYDSAGVAIVEDSDLTGRAPRRQAREPAKRHRGGAACRASIGHRAHAVGDARQAERGERASARRLHGTHRGRAQRHHRELRRASRGAARPPVTSCARETDTETVAHLVESYYEGDLAEAVGQGHQAPRRQLRARRSCTSTTRARSSRRARTRR